MNRAQRRKLPKAKLMPEGQMNVLVNSGGAFVATNLRNPVRWRSRQNPDGTTTYFT